MLLFCDNAALKSPEPEDISGAQNGTETHLLTKQLWNFMNKIWGLHVRVLAVRMISKTLTLDRNKKVRLHKSSFSLSHGSYDFAAMCLTPIELDMRARY